MILGLNPLSSYIYMYIYIYIYIYTHDKGSACFNGGVCISKLISLPLSVEMLVKNTGDVPRTMCTHVQQTVASQRSTIAVPSASSYSPHRTTHRTMEYVPVQKEQ